MRLLIAGLLAATLAVGAWAAEKFEDTGLKVKADAPEGFVKLPELPAKDNFIGEAKGLYLSPDAATNGGAMLVHLMEIPGGADYAAFKGAIAPQLEVVFGNGYKVVKQEDVEVGKLAGFVLEFTCPGDGTKPVPGGSIPHHLRWFFFKEGTGKLIGVLYGARDASWQELSAKFVASEKTLKRVE
ncbi:MAG: hypothetical protein K0Q72_3493 [Armatimonadetes bacterium]|jgi:hypothetical protein|nr:hypothetical protein [Armatimonadota bacterium]